MEKRQKKLKAYLYRVFILRGTGIRDHDCKTDSHTSGGCNIAPFQKEDNFKGFVHMSHHICL